MKHMQPFTNNMSMPACDSGPLIGTGDAGMHEHPPPHNFLSSNLNIFGFSDIYIKFPNDIIKLFIHIYAIVHTYSIHYSVAHTYSYIIYLFIHKRNHVQIFISIILNILNCKYYTDWHTYINKTFSIKTIYILDGKCSVYVCMPISIILAIECLK